MIWLNALHATISKGHACVLVTVREVQGSAPRASATRMLVTKDTFADTIGGGALEQQAIDYSRTLLQGASPNPAYETKHIVLGAELSQCCGGKVTLSYEYHPACTFNLVVFGAGHVAQSIATLVKQLPCRTVFLDSRTQWLEKLPDSDSSLGFIEGRALGSNPFLAVESCPDNAFFLVMTHCHELDFELVEAILSRGDSAYCGLIASTSKAARFKSRLRRKGFTEKELSRLTAPIGQNEHTGKLPMEVAIATLSEILKIRKVQQSNRDTNKTELPLYT